MIFFFSLNPASQRHKTLKMKKKFKISDGVADSKKRHVSLEVFRKFNSEDMTNSISFRLAACY